ncbi:MAG TPA: hypothetical protein VNA20_14965 [Frankiaceae bacterium]|nr:hypothetical protein [Frankiaceae bacterium]
MSPRLARALAVAGAVLVPVSPSVAAPPPGAISANVEYVTNLPELKTAISLNFIGDTMFVSTQTGLFSYDVKDPRAPKLLGALPQEIWENEDVDVDPKRKLVFISRDPRPAPGLVAPLLPKGSITVVDVADPRAMVVKNVFPIDASHTTTCVNGCQWLWSGGPAAFALPVPPHEAGWKGRPIFGTDLRDPLLPKPCPRPIDLKRNDGVTDYAHDVQVDSRGIAWVSGFGGTRGYWTTGRHKNPLNGKVETADGCNPIPYGGGGTTIGRDGALMHNALRNPRYAVDGRRGDVLIGTEERLSSSCEQSGKAATFDLRGTYTGAGWKVTKHRMKTLDTWTPEGAEGADGCASAHYVADRGDGVLAWAFYGQGTRFLDVSNPRRIRQVGYFRPDDASTWAAYFHKGYVFVADNARGVDVVRFKGSAKSPTLAAPARRTPSPLALRFAPSNALGWLCPAPR